MRHTSAGGPSQTSTSAQNDENWTSQATMYPQEDTPRPGSGVPQALGHPTRGSSSRCVLLGSCQPTMAPRFDALTPILSLMQLDLTKLPTEAIYKYLERHDLLPQIVPSPLSNDRPPPPNQLIISRQSAAHNPYYPNYTRPPPHQQRPSVLSDEEGLDTTALCDTDIRTPLANLAQAHWVKTTQINENAIINSFCQALRVKGRHHPLPNSFDD